MLITGHFYSEASLLSLNSFANYLTNRFHVAVHLSSNRSQMTSKCGKNKKVAHEAIAIVIYYWTDARQHGIYLFYIIKN